MWSRPCFQISSSSWATKFRIAGRRLRIPALELAVASVDVILAAFLH